MPAFSYQVLDEHGRKRSGVIEGDSARQVRQQLRDKGLTPLAVEASVEQPSQRKADERSGDMLAILPSGRGGRGAPPTVPGRPPPGRPWSRAPGAAGHRARGPARSVLAAGEADLLDPMRDELARHAGDLLEREQRRVRQVGVVLVEDFLRHAVAAAEVAAVGDADAQVAQRPAARRREYGTTLVLRELATGRGRDIDGRRLVKLAVRISAP